MGAGRRPILILPCDSASRDAAPSTPTITPPATEGQLAHPADVHMQATGFSDVDGDAHSLLGLGDHGKVSTAQRVWNAPCKTFPLGFHIHLGNGTFEGAYTGRTDLEFSTDYHAPGALSRWPHTGWRDGGTSPSRGFSTYPPGSAGGPVAWTPLKPGFVE